MHLPANSSSITWLKTPTMFLMSQRLYECDFKSLYGQIIAVDIKDRLWEAVRASVSVESDPSLEFSAGIWI